MVFKFSVLWIGFLSNTKQPAQVAKDWSLFHGNRFLLHLILGKIKATDGFGTKYLSNECIATLVNEHFQTQWDSVFDAMEAKFPDAYPSYLFRNVGKLKELVEVIAR